MHRIAALAAGDVDHEEQHPAARDVAEELVAETDVRMRAFDQAGNVRDGAAAVSPKLDHADVRLRAW